MNSASDVEIFMKHSFVLAVIHNLLQNIFGKVKIGRK